MKRFAAAAAGMGVLACLLGGCSPTFDWRVMSLGPQARVLLPCKPDRLDRQLRVLDQVVSAHMLVCDAGGLTWSATMFEFPDAPRATSGVRELHRSLRENMKASDTAEHVLQDDNASSSEPELRTRLRGERPDGRSVQAESLFTARGSRAYQLVVLSTPGAPADWSAVAAEFMDGLELSR